MRRATLPEKLLAAVPLLAAACSSDHHVSPWGIAPDLPLRQLFQAPDMDAQLARLDRETGPLGLHLGPEIPIDLPAGGGQARIRGYDGQDPLGRPIHAVRVVTPRGIVMAVGPIDPADLRREQPTELVVALVPTDDGKGAYRSGTDLNGDELPDVVLRGENGTLAIWHVAALGAAPYDVEMAAPPERAQDIDGDGLIDLEGDVPVDPADPLAPRLTDVATFDGGRYTHRSEPARSFHARLAEPPPPPAPGPPVRPEVRLREALERAFHAALGGHASKKEVLDALDQEAVPGALAASFKRHRERIAGLFAPGKE
ncbi:MAG: VCBS repeat-containing protein [Byssovorax sp.]